MDWLDLLAVQGTLKSLLQHHSSEVSIFQLSAFFIVQHSHPYMTTGKTIALTFVGKVRSLLLTWQACYPTINEKPYHMQHYAWNCRAPCWVKGSGRTISLLSRVSRAALPGHTVVKSPPANAGDTGMQVWSLSGEIPWRREWQLQYSCLGNSMDRGA